MTRWLEIKKEWEINDNFPIPPERVLFSLSAIKNEFGDGWFEDRKKTGLGKSLIVLNAVRLADALVACKKAGFEKLTEKLKSNWESDQLQQALSEAEVVIKLLPISEKLKYEPPISGISKKPDFVQYIKGITVHYEVIFPEISAEEKERNQKLKDLADEIRNVFWAGALDVYFLGFNLNRKKCNKILECVKGLNDKLIYTEVNLGETAYLVYDPKGGITNDETNDKKRQIQSDGNVIGGKLVANTNDRSKTYKKHLGLKYTTGLVVFQKSDKPNRFTNFKLLRLFKPAIDNRAFLKVLNKSSQLSQNYPSIVVIKMGRPTASIEDWAEIVTVAFKSGIYTHPSGVWFRELHCGFELYNWREAVLINPYAKFGLSKEIIECIVGKDAIKK
ncbi:hypothetical protein ACFLZL_00970 [Thermodesulfobacteriota bacterium]